MRQESKKSTIEYDPELRRTEHGKKIYHYWKIANKDTDHQEFLSFPGFYAWAMCNGYTIGARLFRHDVGKPYNPDNCFWVFRKEWSYTGRTADQTPTRDMLWMRKWDETVNRIRLHFGMEPIYSPEV